MSSAKTRAAIKLAKLVGTALATSIVIVAALEYIPKDILIPSALVGFLVYFMYSAYNVLVSMEEAKDIGKK